METDVIQDLSPSKELDYLKILKALNEIKFPVGKTLLIDFLSGNMKNQSIKKNSLFTLYNFGALKKYSESEIKSMIDNLIANSMIDHSSLIGNKFAQVLGITSKGSQELMNPSLHKKKISNNFAYTKTSITEEDKLLFKELDFFLSKYNDEQKKSIISQAKNILCIAGAGSGKTTVLTKRIEFLVKYRSVNPQKILAITFTRKARQEMENRLNHLGISGVQVETFNSFSEKILQKYSNLIYTQPSRVMSYSDKIMALSLALGNIGLDFNSATDKYFSEKQKQNKDSSLLNNIFMNDCFSVLEYFKSKNQAIYDFSEDIKGEDKETAKTISSICLDLNNHMKIQGLRDYTDQILDTLKFFKQHPEFIPEFDNILIDEYQDVNAMQIELIDQLISKNPKANLFAVGDPRQSIFGWRGGDINYILKFEEKHNDCEVISLINNYRSSQKIVEFMNHSIKDMKVPDLKSVNPKSETEIKLLDFDSEEDEYNFVLNKIQQLLATTPGDEIFVLARTNRQLAALSQKLKASKIPHVVKTDELRKPALANKGDVTLATIHAIKGLEASIVFVIGCNELNFPCKASDHPIIEVIKIGMQEYDKEEEEKRLFYVAISRAKEKLFLTYSGKKPTYFINPEMLRITKGFEGLF